MRKSVEDWLSKADQDMRAAQRLQGDESLFEATCFHYHQAAEKYLKAFLDSLNARVPRTHDLETLLGLCAESHPEFSRLADEALYLNPFYIAARYPVPGPLPASEERLKKAEAAATKIAETVKEALGV